MGRSCHIRKPPKPRVASSARCVVTTANANVQAFARTTRFSCFLRCFPLACISSKIMLAEPATISSKRARISGWGNSPEYSSSENSSSSRAANSWLPCLAACCRPPLARARFPFAFRRRLDNYEPVRARWRSLVARYRSKPTAPKSDLIASTGPGRSTMRSWIWRLILVLA